MEEESPAPVDVTLEKLTQAMMQPIRLRWVDNPIRESDSEGSGCSLPATREDRLWHASETQALRADFSPLSHLIPKMFCLDWATMGAVGLALIGKHFRTSFAA